MFRIVGIHVLYRSWFSEEWWDDDGDLGRVELESGSDNVIGGVYQRETGKWSIRSTSTIVLGKFYSWSREVRKLILKVRRVVLIFLFFLGFHNGTRHYTYKHNGGFKYNFDLEATLL